MDRDWDGDSAGRGAFNCDGTGLLVGGDLHTVFVLVRADKLGALRCGGFHGGVDGGGLAGFDVGVGGVGDLVGVGKLVVWCGGFEVHRVGRGAAVGEGGADACCEFHAGLGVLRCGDGGLAGGLVDIEGPALRQLSMRRELGACGDVLLFRSGAARLVGRGGDIGVGDLGLLRVELAFLGDGEGGHLLLRGVVRVGDLHRDLDLRVLLQWTLRGDGQVALVVEGGLKDFGDVLGVVGGNDELRARGDILGLLGGGGNTSVAVHVGRGPLRVVLRHIAVPVRGGVAVLVGDDDGEVGVLIGGVRVGDLHTHGGGGASADFLVRGDSDIALVIHGGIHVIRLGGNGVLGAGRSIALAVRGGGLLFLDGQLVVGDLVSVGVVVAAFFDGDGVGVLADR